MKIDFVLPYVNDSDPIWQEQYSKYKNEPSKTEENTINRYRDYGTLKYIFRGIETYLPWINKVFLILSGPSQIPDWLDVNNPKLRIVYHEEYIPKEYLPTFNANTIECFLHKIPDLSEHFIYGNDDMFILKPLHVEDFFLDGKLKVEITYKYINKKDYFTQMCKNDVLFGSRGVIKNTACRSNHTIIPKRKSTMQAVFSFWGDKLLETFTPIRNRKNVSQWMFDVWENRFCRALPSKIKNHIDALLKPDDDLFKDAEIYDTININDHNYFDFEKIKNQQLEFFNVYYPLKSSFEKASTQDKLVSCIVPVYNSANFVIKTLDSIKDQTYKNFECLIIDDGSTDNTAYIIKEYCKKDPRFKYFYKENGGVSSARNFGLEKATGDYICFNDSDDISTPQRFEASVEFLNLGYDITYTLIKFIKLSGEECNPYYIFGKHTPDKFFNEGSNFVTVHGLFGKSEVLKKYRFPDMTISEDVVYNINLLSDTPKVYALNYLGVIHPRRKGSIIHSAKRKGISKDLENKILQEFDKCIDDHKNYPKEIKTFINRIIKQNKNDLNIGNSK